MNASEPAQVNGYTKTGMSASDKQTAGQPEPVHYIAFDGTAVTAKVVSTGCTSADHFVVQSDHVDGVCQLTLVRQRPDYCRRAPFVIDISVPWTLPDDCRELMPEFTNRVIDVQDKLPAKSPARQLPKD